MNPRILTYEERAIIDKTIAGTRRMISYAAQAQLEEEYLFFIGALNLLTRVRKKGYVSELMERELSDFYNNTSTVLAAAFPCSLTVH
jgi:hypothetical protein